MSQKNTIYSAEYPYFRGSNIKIQISWEPEKREGWYRIIGGTNKLPSTYIFEGGELKVSNELSREKAFKVYGYSRRLVCEIFNQHLRNFQQPTIRIENINLREQLGTAKNLSLLLKFGLDRLNKQEISKKSKEIAGKIENLSKDCLNFARNIDTNEDFAPKSEPKEQFLDVLVRLSGIYPEFLPEVTVFLDKLLLEQGNIDLEMPEELKGLDLNRIRLYFQEAINTKAPKDSTELQRYQEQLTWVLQNLTMTPQQAKVFFTFEESLSRTLRSIQSTIIKPSKPKLIR